MANKSTSTKSLPPSTRIPVKKQPPLEISHDAEMNWSTRNMNCDVYKTMKIMAIKMHVPLHFVHNRALRIGLRNLSAEVEE